MLILVLLISFAFPATVSATNTTMNMNLSEIQQGFTQYDTAPLYDAATEPADVPLNLTNDFPKTSFAAWNQGTCGNCWVWAGTALLSQSFYKYNGTAVPLSIQFFNSNFMNGNIGYDKPHPWACTGGFPKTFAEIYTSGVNQTYAGGPFVIPWNNFNASYFDDENAETEDAQTVQPRTFMATWPNMGFSTITPRRVLADPPSNQTAAVENITTALKDGKVIYYSLYWPNETAGNDFSNAFNLGNDTDIYNPDLQNNSPYNVTKDGGSHAMVLVGYNKTDADTSNHYWIVQNSWGTSANRTRGQFRLKMWMNYSGTFNDQNWTSEQYQEFWVYDVAWKTDPAVTGIAPVGGPNDRETSFTNLAGSGFNLTSSTVKLTRSGQTDIDADDVIVDSSTKIQGMFNLSDEVAGPWNVVVTGGDGRFGILHNGFTVTEATPAPTPTPDSGDSPSPDANADKEEAGAGQQDQGEVTVELQTNTLGQTLAPYTVETPEDSGLDVTLGIDQATKTLDAAGNPVKEVGISALSQKEVETITGGTTSPGGAAFSAGGLAVECLPSGATFDKPVSISFTMTKAQWDAAVEKAGGNYKDISVQYYDTAAKTWVSVPTTVDPASHRVTGSAKHFTVFAVFAGTVKPVTAVQSPVAASAPVVTAASAPAMPVATRTTALPVPAQGAPQSAAGMPLATLAAAGTVAMGVLAGSILLARRWWIRRQNPALFREYK